MSEAEAGTQLAHRRSWLASAGAALLALAYVGTRTAAESWPAGRELVLARGTGWVALGALLLSLSCTPIGRMTARVHRDRRRVFAQARRAIGMTAAWLALLHAWLAFSIRLQWNWAAVVHWPHLRAGLTALLVLVVLLATSFQPVIARLRLAFFKQLHHLGYVAALLSLQHLLLSPFAPRALTLPLFGVVLLLGLTRLLALSRA